MSRGSSEIYIQKQILSNFTQNLGERELIITNLHFATEFAKCSQKWKIGEKSPIRVNLARIMIWYEEFGSAYVQSFKLKVKIELWGHHENRYENFGHFKRK